MKYIVRRTFTVEVAVESRHTNFNDICYDADEVFSLALSEGLEPDQYNAWDDVEIFNENGTPVDSV